MYADPLDSPNGGNAYEVSEIPRPEGGGILGGGERFELDTASGSARFAIPLPVPEARGLAPTLTLVYRGGSENGLFGLGVSLDLPSISRRTALGTPRYDSTDQFVSEAGDVLTPRRDLIAGTWRLARREETRNGATYRVTAYRRRIESAFDRIEFWERTEGRESFWTVTGRDNVTAVFGRSSTARIADPEAPGRIFRWMIEERRDTKGNRIVYEYDSDGQSGYASLYPTTVSFAPFNDGNGSEAMAYRYVFDYRDNAQGIPEQRPDVIVSFRPGFELRITRRCAAIGLEHCFPKHLGPDPVRVQEIRLAYDVTWELSLLKTVTRVGYGASFGADAEKAGPPITLGFTEWRPAEACFTPLCADSEGCVPADGDNGALYFADLFGEGVPGVLSLADKPGGAYYWPPEGEGRLGPPAPLPSGPVSALDQPVRHALLDLSGLGHLDAVTLTAGRAGYFGNNGDGTWTPFEAFRGAPLNLEDSSGTFVDLRGDGRPDFLANGPTDWQRNDGLGREGFGAARPILPPRDAATYVNQNEAARVQFTNIFGDGLSHLVRVSSGCVRIWPNLGDGRFGLPRDAPIGIFPDSVTTKDILLADLTGTGGVDICVFGPTEVTIYQNHYGLRFSHARTVSLPLNNSLLSSAAAVDLDGIGVAQIIISASSPNGGQWALDPAKGVAPFLLNRIDNGMGRETELTYRSSTSFYFAARASGEPWLTRSPFPVNVVECVVQRDAVSGATLTRFLEYRDGYFDPLDRQFAGFAYVQLRDDPAMDPKAWQFGPPRELERQSVEAGVEPLFTRTWSYVGDMSRAGALRTAMLSKAYRDGPDPLVLPAPHFDPALENADAETRRLAWRALTNRSVRSEAFPISRDGTIEPVPFGADQNAYAVRLVQPAMDGQPAVVLVLERESAHISYERRADDPQTSHTLKTAFDTFGQWTRTLTVGYARCPRQGRQILPAQTAAELRLATRGLINHVDGAYRNSNGGTARPFCEQDGTSEHFVGLPFVEQSFELAGFDRPDPHFSYNQAAAVVDACLVDVLPYGEPFTDGPQTRLFAWTQTHYWDADQTVAPLQRTGPQALVHHTAKAAFSESFVSGYYGDKVDAALLAAHGGYAHADGYWWWPGNTARYAGRERYCVPVGTVDPFGAETSIEHDSYDLFVTKRINAKDDTVTAIYDYRALSPARIVDENEITTEFAYDPLAEVQLCAVFGMEGDVVVGDQPLSTYTPQLPASPEEVLADPPRYLQGMGRYFLYDLKAWNRTPRLPPFTLELERRRFARARDAQSGEAAGEIVITLRYFDGAGRDLSAAALVSGQPPYALFGDGAPRQASRIGTPGEGFSTEWLITNQVRYDSRGDVVTRYQPYFADVPSYQRRPAAACWILHHDGLHREVEAETPKGFLTRVEYSSWSETRWDEDDLVTLSPYYVAHIDDPNTPQAEKEALIQAAAFENTPTVSVRDVLGRTVQIIRYLVDTPEPEPAGKGNAYHGKVLSTYAWYDALDKETAFADARFYNADAPSNPDYFNYFVAYDMLGHGIWQKSADSGNVALRSADEGIPQIRLFDGGGQPVAEWNRRGYRIDTAYDALRQPTALRTRGPDLDIVSQRFVYGDDPDANTVNRLVETMDQAGILSTDSYTILGDPTTCSRRFTTTPAEAVDWRDPGNVPLQDKVWGWRNSWNALSERSGWTAPNGARVKTAYSLNGWAKTVCLGNDDPPSEFAAVTSFAPDGRPKSMSLLHAVEVNATYDPSTLRLTKTNARTPSGSVVLDLGYTYDPAGNVSQIHDAAPVGGGASDVRRYRYDSLYRLRHATGRRQAQPGSGTPEAYARRYTFDASDNLTARLDDAGEVFSTVYAVSASSDHAVTETMSARGGPDDYFDADGLMTELPNKAMLAYDPAGQLARAQTAQTLAAYQYAADGARVRKSLSPNDGGATIETDYLEDYVAIGGADGRGELVLSLGDQLIAVIHYPRASTANDAEPRLQLSDRIHSVAYELAAVGTVLSGQSYYPFGETAVYAAPSADPIEDKRYQFAGRERDPESGLYHFAARSYAPVLGRWITPDPAGTIDGPNLFAYVHNNPISRVDPTGENGGDGDDHKGSADSVFKGLKFANKIGVFFNAFGELAGTPVHHVITNLQSTRLQFLSATSLSFGGFAAYGGIFGAAYYARDIQKKGLNPYNFTSFAGNLFFAAEGILIYRTVFAATNHALHSAHQRIGIVGFIADTLKVPKAIKDEDYGIAGLYTSLGVGNLRSGVTTEQATRAYTGILQGLSSLYNASLPRGYALITREMIVSGAARAARVPGPLISLPYIAGYLAYKYKSAKASIKQS